MWINFVNAVEPRMASFRYRSVWPSMAMADAGHQYLITDDPTQIPMDRSTKGIIFTKTFNQKALELAWQAKSHDIPILLDVCDNIFVPNYLGGTKGLLTVACFRSMAEFAEHILVPSQALAELVEQQLAPLKRPISVIADCVEHEADVRKLLETLEHTKRANGEPIALSESLSVIPATRGRSGTSEPTAISQSKVARLSSMLAHARSNDLNANIAALQVRYEMLREKLPNYQSRAHSMPSKPNLANYSNAAKHQSNRKTVLWFGNAGHGHGNYGIPTILRFADALSRIHKETPIELLVVSNNEPKFIEYIRRLAIPSRYVEWHPLGLFEQLKAADVVILPNSNDEFSKTKSANRVLLALSQGVPVVAEDFAGLQLLRDSVACEDIYSGLHRYLVDSNATQNIQQDIDRAQLVIEQHFSRHQVGLQLASVLRSVADNDPRKRPCLLFVFDLLQDIEILKPILEHFAQQSRWRVRILASNWLMSQPAELSEYFAEKGLQANVMEREDILNGDPRAIMGCDLIFLASETNLGPHRVAHCLATQAGKAHIPSVTFQHGLENEGLSYFGENKSVRFASQNIVVWSDHGISQNKVRKDTREKCLPMGIFRSTDEQLPVDSLHQQLDYDRVIGIFENLHWERYSERYRMQFLSNLITAANTNTDCCFLVKPHPAGRWFDLADDIPGNLPSNITVIEHNSQFWRRLSTNHLIKLVDAVITTPSTITIDAAIAKVPVAVAVHNLERIDAYHGLDQLLSSEDWLSFIDACKTDQAPILKRVERFLSERVDKINPMAELEQHVAEWLASA